MVEAKNQINDLEHKEAKAEQEEEKRINNNNNNNEGSISSLWDNFKRSNIHTIGVPEGEEEEQEIENLFENIVLAGLAQ